MIWNFVSATKLEFHQREKLVILMILYITTERYPLIIYMHITNFNISYIRHGNREASSLLPSYHRYTNHHKQTCSSPLRSY